MVIVYQIKLQTGVLLMYSHKESECVIDQVEAKIQKPLIVINERKKTVFAYGLKKTQNPATVFRSENKTRKTLTIFLISKSYMNE